MYDKKTKPLRACVPVDPFESALIVRGYAGREGGREGGGVGGGRMKPITVGERSRAALDFGA